MKKALVVASSLGVLVFLAYAVAQQSTPQGEQPQKFHLATPGQPIAGIPFDEVQKIFDRHVQELHNLPGTISVNFTAEGLVARTANPEALPPAVEGLPVFAIPPVDPDAVGALQKGLPARPSSPPQPEPTPHPEPPHVVEHPPLLDCPPGMHREPGEVRCRFDTPLVDPEPEPVLNPPPPGVIVLKPGKVREQAETCPQGFNEVEGYGGWRFCVDSNKPEPIPPLWSPPVKGIPYEKVLEIHQRHVEKLAELPGVESVGLRDDGIHVYTSNPDMVPKEVEGVPIITHSATGGTIKPLVHSYDNNWGLPHQYQPTRILPP